MILFFSLLFASLTAPLPAEEPATRTIEAVVTAYTSSEDETDDTPDINASGGRPGPGSIACPRSMDFGTKVQIEGKEYMCDDRMHPRFKDRFDMWMPTKEEALEWGVRTVTIFL